MKYLIILILLSINAHANESLRLAKLAEQEILEGNATNGILLALEALPKNIYKPDKPYVVEAEIQLLNGLLQLHEYYENIDFFSTALHSENKYEVNFYTGNYRWRQALANEDNCAAYAEQHFNASASRRDGYTMVIVSYESSKKVRKWAKWYVQKVARAFGVRQYLGKGILIGGYDGRGNGNLKYLKMPGVLLESLFATNPRHAKWIRNEADQLQLAFILFKSIRKFFPQGGRICFSVGHKYKFYPRNDRGAHIYGGGRESEYAEIILKQAQSLIEYKLLKGHFAPPLIKKLQKFVRSNLHLSALEFDEALFDKTSELLLKLSSQQLIDYAREIVPRCSLTVEQRERFGLGKSKSQRLIERGEKLARRGRIKSAIRLFKRARKLDHCLEFNSEDKARWIAAQAEIYKAEKLAEQIKIEAAIAKFNKAMQIYSKFKIDSDKETRQIAADELIEDGEKLAEAGEIETALTKFQTARKINVNLNFDPHEKVRTIAIKPLVKKGIQAIRQTNMEQALIINKKTHILDPKGLYSESFWSSLCWYGSLHGHAAAVMNACTKIVKLQPNNESYRDSRGVARALIGDFKGAIADFEFYVKHAKLKHKLALRQQWLNQLREGTNPFTETVINKLLGK
jgi:tetratricopeptide (TPR) repeat protein